MLGDESKCWITLSTLPMPKDNGKREVQTFRIIALSRIVVRSFGGASAIKRYREYLCIYIYMAPLLAISTCVQQNNRNNIQWRERVMCQ